VDPLEEEFKETHQDATEPNKKGKLEERSLNTTKQHHCYSRKVTIKTGSETEI